jgi:polyribonucleotide 5'-hydroxyl-kinase
MVKEWAIPAGGEFRVEVDFGVMVVIKLVSGAAEVFGAELAPTRDYQFTGRKVAVFSYEGAVISVDWPSTNSKSGELSPQLVNNVEYVSTESVAVPAYLSFFKSITDNDQQHNNILILGAGRNTLARTLCNYHARQDRKLMWVSVDVRTNPLFFPGTISANLFTGGQVVEAEEPGLLAGMASESCSPLTLFYGSLAIADNQKLWGKLVEKMAGIVEERRKKSASDCAMVVVGPGDQDCESMPLLPQDLVKTFSIGTVVVVGNERLHVRLSRSMSSLCRVVKMPKSGGTVPYPRPGDFDQSTRYRLFENYFYGSQRQLNPFTQTLTFATTGDDSNGMQLYKALLGSDGVAPMSALPLGATRKLDECRAVRIPDPTNSDLLYSIIAVLHHPGSTTTESILVSGTVVGFFHIVAVDEQRRTITVLSPCPGDPPSKIFVVGQMKWIETGR